MVRGIESFREWFRGYEDQYAIIGGTACDLLMSDEGLDFRATKDIDLVLIIEAVDTDFGKRFWEYVVTAGYEHRNMSTGEPQFYRFTNPITKEYPTMIELFTRKPDAVTLPDGAVLTPLLMDEYVSSLSAILLNSDYYDFLKQGLIRISGVTVLDAPYLIPFKAKAWLDLSTGKSNGKQIDSRKIKKHKNDVFRLTELLGRNKKPFSDLPESIKVDMNEFIVQMTIEDVDLKQIGIHGKNKDTILKELKAIYVSE